MSAERPRSSDDEEFDRIVAGLDLSVPSELDDPPRREPAPVEDDPADDLPEHRDVFQPRMSDPLGEPEPDEDDGPDDHFVPPEIGPSEPLDTATRIAWVGLVGPPAILVVATVIGYLLPRAVSAVLVLTSIAALVYLIGRRGNDHRDDDPDHGAVL
ncbi:hypothetical protein [Solicola sp. PLA-1-18]|uniref:hypothetical protein n=1 Tax=Solicola sp. PLA-1-18 TaxID=3380532 RepID=UPI003B774121